jgi:hypothetical protein
MAGIFLVLVAVELVVTGFSIRSLVVAVLLGVGGVWLVVQGVGTIVVRRRDRAAE